MFDFQNVKDLLIIFLLLLILYSLHKKNVHLIVRRSFVVIVYQISKFSPRSRKLIVFGGENGTGFRGNTKYLFYEATHYEKIKCVWILKTAEAIQAVRDQGFEAYSHKSLKGVYYQLRAKTIVHSHSVHDDFNKIFLGGAISVSTWHGVGLKKSVGS